MQRQTPPNGPQSQANFILVMVLTGVLLFAWPAIIGHFYPNAGRHAASSAPPANPAASSNAPVAADPASLKPTREGGLTSTEDQAIEARQLAGALAPAHNSPGGRVPIAAPGLSGSLNLTGGVIDDLTLNRHRASLDRHSGPVRLFSPAGTIGQHFARFGWASTRGAPDPNLPSDATVWQAPPGARLTPTSPVTLTWTSPARVIFTLTYAIDRDYLITVTQAVQNNGTAAVAMQPFALITRTNRTASLDSWQIHSGPFGAFDGTLNFWVSYHCGWTLFSHCDDLQKLGALANSGHTDWLGFTDIYWMSVLVPQPEANGTASVFRALGDGLYRADLTYAPETLAPGARASLATRLFAGAKESAVLDRYEQAGIPKLGYAIDWGWFWFIEKPIFALLTWLFSLVGNFGVAIVLLTIVIRVFMFPVAQRQFASMAAMKALQPKLKAINERYKDDQAKRQEETMKLYKEESVNPLAGCLPIFLQIPIFVALYKVLNVAIEMRQQPFLLWVRDLSVPDPLHILNGFGLIPWDPPSLLSVGPLALVLGFTMWLQFRLQPAQPDPAQQQMMQIMPWMMMLFMAPLAAGILIYYIMNNFISVGQQAYLYARHPQMRAMVEKERADVAAAAHRDRA